MESIIPDPGKCKATLRNGKTCKNKAYCNYGLCKIHILHNVETRSIKKSLKKTETLKTEPIKTEPIKTETVQPIQILTRRLAERILYNTNSTVKEKRQAERFIEKDDDNRRLERDRKIVENGGRLPTHLTGTRPIRKVKYPSPKYTNLTDRPETIEDLIRKDKIYSKFYNRHGLQR